MSVENPSCAHPLLPNSISWSGQLHNCQQPPSNASQLDNTHQSSRSWARSKRISLGCIEFRTTHSGRGRSPRPKSTCSKLETSNSDTSKAHPSQLAAMNSRTGTVAVASADSDVCHGNTLYKSSRSNKARSGADALLRRLRMRSSAKPRSQTPNECRSNNAAPAFMAVTRSSSAPRPCASPSNDEDVRLTSVFIGRPLRMQLDTSERSTLSLKSAPELADADSSIELPPMSTENGRKSAGFAELMTQSFIPSRPVGFNVCDPLCFENTFIKASQPFYNSRPTLSTWEPSWDNALHRSLYRPLSQPTCTCKSHSVHSMNSDRSYTLPTAHAFHYPRPTLSPSVCGHPSRADTRPQPENLPFVCYQHPQPFSLLQYAHPPSAHGKLNTTYWSRQDNLSRSPSSNTNLPSNASQFVRSAVAVGQWNESNSTRSSDIDAVLGASSDSTPVQWSDIPQNPYRQMEPHLGSNPFTLNRCSMMMCSQTEPIPNYAQASSLRPIAARCFHKHNNLSPNSDAQHYYSHQNRPGDCAEIPHRNVSSPGSRMLDGKLICAVTSVTTRPDSLLSSSSLTADSSLSDSTPNSCSSRDSALGSTIQQNVSEHHTQNNLNAPRALESSGIKPLREPTENCRSTPNHYHHTSAVPRVTSRTYPTPTHPSLPCELKLPPTPRRQYWSPPAPEDGTSVHRLSQRLRMERKHSVYVNSAICPLPEHPSGHSRTSTTRMSPPASWTQLLPYRVSTVPQNLSERLKKSETLPNDVWIHAQQSSNVPEVRTLTCSQSHAEDLGMVSTNGPRSPPPRPPMRTTSQKLTQANHPGLRANAEQSSRGFTLGNHNPAWLSGGQTRIEKVEHVQNTRTDSSPVLCRYSQLYSLPFNPKLVSQIPHTTVHPQPTVTYTTTACLGGSGEATSDMYDMRMERLDLAS